MEECGEKFFSHYRWYIIRVYFKPNNIVTLVIQRLYIHSIEAPPPTFVAHCDLIQIRTVSLTSFEIQNNFLNVFFCTYKAIPYYISQWENFKLRYFLVRNSFFRSRSHGKCILRIHNTKTMEQSNIIKICFRISLV